MEAQSAPQQPPAPVKRRFSWWRAIGWFFKGLVLLLVLLLAAAGAGGYWLLQTQSGQAWLAGEANKYLDGGIPNGKMRIQITSLSGSLPFTINVGVKLLDDRGVFMEAPRNSFVWNWRDLPKALTIDNLSVTDAVLCRLPDLPAKPDEPKEPEKTFTFDDLRAAIGDAAKFLAEPPSWLPEARIKNIALVNASIPQSLLAPGENADRVPENAAAAENEAEEGKAFSADCPAAGRMLRADADMRLFLERPGARVELSARLAAEAGQRVLLPRFAFEAANVDLSLAATPQKDGLAAHLDFASSLDGPRLETGNLPEDLLGDAASLRTGLDITAKCPAYGPTEGLEVKLTGPNLDAGRLGAEGGGGWQSGPDFVRGLLDGDVDYRLKFSLASGSEGEHDLLAMLKAPFALNLAASGKVQKPSINLVASCAEIEAEGHKIENIRLELGGRELALPLGARALAADEAKLDLHLDGALDGHKLALATGLFYRQERDGAFAAGLRQLDMLACGVRGTGDVTADVADGRKPELAGALKLRVEDWQALSALLPGKRLAGNALVDLQLSRGANGQDAAVTVEMPAFSFAEGAKTLVSLRDFNCRANLADVFGKPAVDAKLALARAESAGMRFGARVEARGPLAGPLAAKVESSGSVAARLEAVWEPGRVEVGVLRARMDLPSKGGPVAVGVRAAGPLRLAYGDGGLGVENVDLQIIPAGRLTASGGLSAQKLDMALKLSGFNFRAWKKLAPQLPEGALEVAASLSGTPQRPGGKFRVGVADLKIPGVALKPLTLALVGAIEPRGGNRGLLAAKLELPQNTVATLGGTKSAVEARLPLVFGADGMPKPDMRGDLAARIAWEGALGPLWNLVPVADMRLNGRINMAVDATGTLERPKVRGAINIDNGRYENVAFGVLLTAIKMKLAVDGAGLPADGKIPGALRLDMSASDGRGGGVTVAGGGSLGGNDLNIQAKINRLRPLRRRDVHVELSGGAKVSGSALAPVIDGEIVVDKGEVLLDNIDMGASSITTLPITTQAQLEKAAREAAQKRERSGTQKAGSGAASKAGPAQKTPPKGPGSLHVRIVMPPRFSVEGRGLTSLWQANLLVSGTLEDVAITGEVSCFRGTFDFLGKNFVLSRGTVTFAGGSIANPLLDIELTNETPDLTAHLWITGPVNKMKLSLTSDPSLPRDDILSRVLFGRSVNELSRLEALQLAGAVAQLAGFTGNGSGIFQFGKKALGLDVLRFGSSGGGPGGEPGDTTASGSTLEAGKYLNDWLYMGVQQGMKADSTAFIMEIELSPRSNIEVKTEQSSTWAGYKWKYNY